MNDGHSNSSAPAGVQPQRFGAAGGAAAFCGRVDLSEPLLHTSRPIRSAGVDGAVRVEAPGVQIHMDASRVDCDVQERTITICTGAPRIAGGSARASAADVARELSRRGRIDAGWLRGRFAIVQLDMRARTITTATDRFGVHPICYSHEGATVAFADRADALPSVASQLDWQSLYDYVYFHVIPAPRTVFRDVTRLEPAQVVDIGADGKRQRFWWEPCFEADPEVGIDRLQRRFTELLQAAVERDVDTDRIGSFLSGGTDSSTVAGFLARVTGRPPQTFSIGFDAAGYDEMAYARIAARHFGAEHHEYYVTPDDLVRAIPHVAARYDQPFGNSSALPAYYCALRAKA
ncbi:MAG: asparagine synthase-related protein, partial [Burkholderiaceae bacterium]|nr:asparagine synthase-related protein [Burkholderiaceae bacterium]